MVIHHERKRLYRPVKITIDAASLEKMSGKYLFDMAEIFYERVIQYQGLVIKDEHAFYRIIINQETKRYQEGRD